MLVIALYTHPGHVLSYVSHLKAINPLVDVTILTNRPDEYKDMVRQAVKIIVYDVTVDKRIKFQWLRMFAIKHKQIRFFSKFSKKRRYDIVNVHYANKFMPYVYRYLRTMSDNIVLTPWGSDILRRPRKDMEQLSYLYKKADYIAASPTSPVGKTILQEFKVDPKKLVGSFWGAEGIDYIINNENQISQDDAKERFGIVGRYVITCGYNKLEAQRHKIIIAAIDQVREHLPDNLTLLFPVNYISGRSTYVEEIEAECKKRNLHAVFVTEFLSGENLYKLRMATDIFVHVQTTDAFSGSVQEYILCKKKIVHGSWMKYEVINDIRPLFYFPVDKLECLGEVIVKAYKSENISIPQEVIDYVKGSSWDNKATLMNNFFMTIV